MSKFTKIKKMFFIALGFGLATYLIMSGMAMLDAGEKLAKSSSEVHTNTVQGSMLSDKNTTVNP
jgi:hypothetical protein